MRLTTLALTLTLAGCATMTAIGGTEPPVCLVWRPVTWSVHDTDQTIREAKANNAARLGYGCRK